MRAYATDERTNNLDMPRFMQMLTERERGVSGGVVRAERTKGYEELGAHVGGSGAAKEECRGAMTKARIQGHTSRLGPTPSP